MLRPLREEGIALLCHDGSLKTQGSAVIFTYVVTVHKYLNIAIFC